MQSHLTNDKTSLYKVYYLIIIFQNAYVTPLKLNINISEIY